MNDILVYLAFFLIEFVVCVFAKKYKFKILLLLTILLPVTFIGFRFYVGTDYQSYMTFFERISHTNTFTELMELKWEKGALILFKLVSFFTKDPKIVFIPIAILTIVPLFYANKIYDYKYLPLSFLIYNLVYLPFCLNGMRQGIAMSFILLSFALLFKYIFWGSLWPTAKLL